MNQEGKNVIVCIGEVLWDMLPDGPQPGGAPMNVAIHLKRQNIDPILVSRVGNDLDGRQLREFLTSSGIGLKFLQTDEELPTSRVNIKLDAEKNATYEICEPVAWDNICWDEPLGKLAEEATLIIFGTLASRNDATRRTLLRFLDHSEGLRFLDVNLRPPYDKRELVEQFLGLADFVKLNEEELVKIASWNGVKGSLKKMTVWLSDKYVCPDVCVTRGAKGALLYREGIILEHPGFRVDAVDTVGAGDAFLAGLVAGLLKNNAAGAALDYACATGAYVASKPGAVPQYSPAAIAYQGFRKA
jgi:fructokinase